MADTEHLLNAQQRKKAARKQRKQSERGAHRNLDEITGEATELALQLAPEVAAGTRGTDDERVIDVELASVSEANFVRKRVNDVLTVAEWHDVVKVWVWEADRHHRSPLSDSGRSRGFELRLEQAPPQ